MSQFRPPGGRFAPPSDDGAWTGGGRAAALRPFSANPCGPQKLRADSPYATYPLDVITTLQRLMRWPAEEAKDCTITGPLECRGYRETCRCKSGPGNWQCRPGSLREVQRVTGSTEFPDKPSRKGRAQPRRLQRAANPAVASLNNIRGCRPRERRGKAVAGLATTPAGPDRTLRGSRGDMRGELHGALRESLLGGPQGLHSGG